MQFDRGYLSPYFITDPEKMEAVLEDAYVLVHEKKIATMKDLLPVLEKVAQSGKPLLIIAEDVEGEAAGDAGGGGQQAARHPEGCARSRPRASATGARSCSRNIATVTAGKVISEELGFKLENIGLDDLGHVKRIVVDKDNTTLIAARVSRPRSKAASARIRAAIEKSTSDTTRRAAGAAREAGGRRRGGQCGRGHRDRNEEKKARVGRRAARDPRRGRKRASCQAAVSHSCGVRSPSRRSGRR